MLRRKPSVSGALMGLGRKRRHLSPFSHSQSRKSIPLSCSLASLQNCKAGGGEEGKMNGED